MARRCAGSVLPGTKADVRMKLPPDFPRRLRAARAAAGLSQSALALRAGLHAVAYGRIERGVDHPRAGTLRAICRALSASADSLLNLNPADGGQGSNDAS